MFGFAIMVSPILRVAKGEGGGRGYQLCITPIIFKLSRITRITEKINKVLTTLTSVLLSHFIWTKSEVEERKKGRSWCHSFNVFLMSLLLVSNDINHYGNFKGKSWVTRCENSKSRNKLLRPITPLVANLGPITHHADGSPSRVTENPFATLYTIILGRFDVFFTLTAYHTFKLRAALLFSPLISQCEL